MEKRYQGVYPVVFTPLATDGAIDVPALQRTVDYLIETEAEMAKVVWPSWSDTRSGAVAVVVTVVIMLVFLWVVDTIFLEGFNRLFSLSLRSA